MNRRTLTMTWDGLGDDDDDDLFFESSERLSSAVPVDLGSSGSDDDDDKFQDSRLSFSSTISSSASFKSFQGLEAARPYSMLQDYNLWMAEPGDIRDRRKRLLQGMGLSSNKDLLRLTSAKLARAISTKKIDTGQDSRTKDTDSCPAEESKQDPQDPSPTTQITIVRSRSDGDIQSSSVNTKRRKEELIGSVSKQRLTRTSSGLFRPSTGLSHFANAAKLSPKRVKNKPSVENSGMLSSMSSNGGIPTFFLIKNLDTGMEFIVKEQNGEGMLNKLSDLQTGKQLTMEEFEKSVGYSPVVKELMRRQNVSRNSYDGSKVNVNSSLSKSFKSSKKRGVSLLKNIKGVANSMSLKVDREKESSSPVEQKANKSPSKWIKVRQHGKPYKEFTALHKSQQIQAHEGSIWTIKFSTDSRYLASAGEDRIIHVWEVQECDVVSGRPSDDLNSISSTPVHPMASSACSTPVNPVIGSPSSRPPLAEIAPLPSQKRKKRKNLGKRKENSIPDYVSVQETVFALSEKPICTFKGHLDDVLDLSWSRSKLLLSSSMDKTVRLWHMESKSCLKLFAHNDYVTSIQFNPIDDDYFISGSLDAKVRIWSIPDRQVIDWTDLHEMVTAARYTPDGKGAIIGSHKGWCRRYTITDSKLEFKDAFELQTKKKSQSKKVTGFEFALWNPDEVLITSADSRIRIFDGSVITHKFRGFRNTSSQINASFSPDGKHVVSASEDSNVYIWKREEAKNAGGSGKGKTWITSLAHEHFHCKDVSVAIPWPGTTKHEPPLVQIRSKRHSKRFTPPPSPSREDYNSSSTATNSKRYLQLPPLSPLRQKATTTLERSTSCPDEDLAQSSQANSGIGARSDSFNSAVYPSPIRYGDPHSISTSWSFRDGHGANTVQATAWGLVIVTASLGGEIRVYQNFGLPLKVSRQTSIFKDLT